MRSLHGFPVISAALVFQGCAADDGIAPRLPSGMALPVVSDVYAARDKGDILLASGGAQAKVYCIGSSCYAAAFEFKDYKSDPDFPGPYTLFSAYFQNLQGTYPLGGPNTPLKLNFIRFRFFDPNDDPPYVDAYPIMTVSAVGDVEEGHVQPAGHWLNDGPIAGPGPNYDTWEYLPGLGIVGCDVPALFSFSFRSCPGRGLDGWVKFDFKLRHIGSRVPVRFHDFVFSFGSVSPLAVCTIGGNEQGTCTELPYHRAMHP